VYHQISGTHHLRLSLVTAESKACCLLVFQNSENSSITCKHNYFKTGNKDTKQNQLYLKSSPEQCPVFFLCWAQTPFAIFALPSDWMIRHPKTLIHLSVLSYISLSFCIKWRWRERKEGKLERSLPYITCSLLCSSPSLASVSTRLNSPQWAYSDPLGICEELCRAGKQVPSQPNCAATRKTFSRELTQCCAWLATVPRGVSSALSRCRTPKPYESQHVLLCGHRATEDKPLNTISGQLKQPSKSCFSLQANRTGS